MPRPCRCRPQGNGRRGDIPPLDREGDIFEVFEAWQLAAGEGRAAEWIIRANQDRALTGMLEEDPIRWVLLTSKEVTTLEEARRILNLYLRRWHIEVFHRVLKTGCRVERIQLKTAEALTCALVIYAVIAWRILYLTHLGRNCPDMPCSCVFEEEEWLVGFMLPGSRLLSCRTRQAGRCGQAGQGGNLRWCYGCTHRLI